MRLHATRRATLLVLCAIFNVVQPQSSEPMPATLLGGIGNVASSATNFLSGVVQRQKELLHRVTDTATDYINSAVERPRNLLINATRATTGYIDSAASRGLEFKLKRFLERFRPRMRYGIPELGIPVLEPLELDEIDLVINNPEIGNINLVLQDLVISQISTFVIRGARLSLAEPTITVNLSIPEILANGRYNISGIIGNKFLLYGAGPLDVRIYDFRLYVNTVLGYSRRMYVKKFDLDFSLRALDSNLENFMGGDEVGHVMNQVLQDLAPQALEIIKPDILPEIQSYVAGRVNETIHHLTMRDVFNVLLGQNEIRNFAHLLAP